MINRIAGVAAPGNGRRKALAESRRPMIARGERRPGDLGKRLENCIGDHPVLSIALGLTLGIVIGCLIKRR